MAGLNEAEERTLPRHFAVVSVIRLKLDVVGRVEDMMGMGGPFL